MSASLPPDLRARILAAAKSEPSPTRPETQRHAAIAIAVGYAASLAVFVLCGGGEMTRRPIALIAVTALGWAGVSIACTISALARRKSMLGLSREMLVGLAIAAAPVLFAWGMMWTHVFEPPVYTVGMPIHVFCFAATLLLALGPLVAFAYVRRGSDPVHPTATGALLGAAAGAWGSFLIDLHCAVTSAVHVAFGHVFPTVVLGALGAWVGARVLGVRAPR